MDKIITATGKEFDCDYLTVRPSSDRAFIRVIAPIETVASVFCNKTETAKLEYCGEVLSGYTKFVSIINEGDAFKVCLDKESE